MKLKNRFIFIFLAFAAVALVLLWVSGVKEYGSGDEVDEPPVAGLKAQTEITASLATVEEPKALEVVESKDDGDQSGEPDERVFDLFTERRKAEIEWTGRNPAAKRVSEVVPDQALLSAQPLLEQGDILGLDLFEDTSLSARITRVTRYPNGAVGMTAELLNRKGLLFLSYSGGELRASAEIQGENDYYVRYRKSDGAHYAIEVDPIRSIKQECTPPLVPPAAARALAEEIETESSDQPKASGDPVSPLSADTVVIDVMVVYTPAALAVEGSANAINNNIALAMEKGNEVHANSDTRVYLNLVHSAETAYTENGDPTQDLYELTYTGGSHSEMDAVHDWRDTYSADLVCLLEDEPGTGGLGWTLNDELGNPEYGFCLARVQQSDWTYTVVHEWGHNMGCSHSKTQNQSPWEASDLFFYSAGWQWADTASSASIGYCSVMTYENFDGNSGNGYEYEEVPYFSNPNISYTGDSSNPVGDADHGDNARAIRATRYPVADYRIALVAIDQYPYTNSFEAGYGEWNYYMGNALWEREDGSDANLVANVPNIATTNAADGEIFLMTDGAEYSNTNAYLQAVFDFASLANINFQFSYCMYSAWGIEGTNSLQVSTNSGSSWIELWSNSGEADNAWYVQNIDLDNYAGQAEVHLRFKAELGPTWSENYMCLDAFSVTGTVVSADQDGDGLPDDWETTYFGGPTNANPTATASNQVNTVMETYIAGIDPTDPDAFFEFSGLGIQSSNTILSWPSVSGRVYSVYWTSNLFNNFQIIESNLTSGAYTDNLHNAEDTGFYRIEVQLEP